MKRVMQISGGLVLVAITALVVGTGVAGAARSLPARVPVLVFRLHASLAPVGSASGSGRFDALLIRTGPGELKGGVLPGAVAAPRIVCPPDPRMGVPCIMGGGGGGAPPLPVPVVPATGVHWLLIWRLGLTGVTGPVTATVHLGAQGAASPTLTTLCSSCQVVARGHMAVTTDQAQQLLKGTGTVDVQATSGQLAGTITVVNHFLFSAPVRRTRA